MSDPFVVEMARLACVIEDWPLPDANSEETHSLLPGDEDTIIIAAGVGAAWTFRHDPPLLLDTDGAPIAEIAIAVVPEMRGNGAGGALLDALIADCAGKHKALSLNVHQRNPAIHLYQRKGFQAVGHRRGALGVAMALTI